MKSTAYNTTKEKAFEACKKALNDLKCTLIDQNFNTGIISAKKSGNLLSYGHNLTLNILENKSNQVEIIVESNSTGIQIIDWGTNKENEEKLIDLISKKLL